VNAKEALGIVRLAKGAFPATTFDDLTPEAWALALEYDRFEDARDALKLLMREQTFIHVSDIVSRIRRIRNDRITEFGPLPEPPAAVAESNVAYQRWLRATIRDIGDGTLTERPAIAAGVERPRELDFTNVFRGVDEDGAA